MNDVPVVLALTAGMLAAVNPCGFALLPAYLGLLVTGEQPVSRGVALARALLLSAGMSLGFAAVFGVFGLALAPVADTLRRALPWFTFAFGLLLAGLGGWLAVGRSMPSLPASLLPAPRRGTQIQRGLGSMAVFGAGYALASLGCTAAPFLALVVSSFHAGSLGAGVLLWLAYAAGMGLVAATAAIAVALARHSLVSAMRAFASRVATASGVLLVVTGCYVAYYGWWEARTGSGGPDPVVDTAGRVQGWLADRLEELGPGALTLTLAGVLAGGLAATVLGGRGRAGGTRRWRNRRISATVEPGRRGPGRRTEGKERPIPPPG